MLLLLLLMLLLLLLMIAAAAAALDSASSVPDDPRRGTLNIPLVGEVGRKNKGPPLVSRRNKGGGGPLVSQRKKSPTLRGKKVLQPLSLEWRVPDPKGGLVGTIKNTFWAVRKPAYYSDGLVAL